MTILPRYTSYFLHIFLLGGFLLGLSACGQEERAEIARMAEEVHALTEAHTRVVWVQDTTDLTDVFAQGNQLRLMGYDSKDGKGSRVILSGPANFTKPMITRRGDRIVYSDGQHGYAYIVDWNGQEPSRLTKGFALAVWINPDDKTEWIYVGRYKTGTRGDPFDVVIRLPLNQPDREELVWDHTTVGADNFQLSADGTRASGVFPWPTCGVADLTTHTLTRYGRGCWTSYTPDNSYLFWYFDGAHRNVRIVNERTEERWQVNINNAPGMEGYEVYHPRWSNHPRFITVTGPYKMRAGGNNIRGGGPDVEIYIGRFSEDFKRIEQWVRVTQNPYANFYPDVWINPEDQPLPVVADTNLSFYVNGDETASIPLDTFDAEAWTSQPLYVGGQPDGQKNWSGYVEGVAIHNRALTDEEALRQTRAYARILAEREDPVTVTVKARLTQATSIPDPEAILPYRRGLVANEYEVLEVLDGELDDPYILVAHWVIRDEQTLDTAEREEGSIHIMTIALYDDRPELEGERLSIDTDNFMLELYYDLNL